MTLFKTQYLASSFDLLLLTAWKTSIHLGTLINTIRSKQVPTIERVDFHSESAFTMFSESDSDGVVFPLSKIPTELQKAKRTPTYLSPPNSPPPADLPYVYNEHRESEDGKTPRTISVIRTPPTSPPRDLPNLTASNERPADHTGQIDSATLRFRLNLDSGRCGGLTIEGSPCRRYITKKQKRPEVNSLIESLLTLPQSSPELEIQLESLAKLVHCRSHDHGLPIESRLDQWIAAFPAGDHGTKPLIPLERQIKKALGQIPTRCVEKAQKQKTCLSEIGGQKVQNCTAAIDEIVYSAIYLRHDETIEYFLKVLECNMLCPQHENQPLKKVGSWKSRIMEICRAFQADNVRLIDSNTPKGHNGFEKISAYQVSRNSSLRNDASCNTQNQVVSAPMNSPPSSLWPDIDPATFWIAAYDVRPFDVIEKSDKLEDRESSFDEIRKKAKTALCEEKGDLKDGYVYLYEVEGNKGLVKIGYTNRTLDERHKEWEFACNRIPKLLYPDPSNPQKVPNAHRVEALCHAELNHRRLRIYCKGCLKQHIEWFEIAPTEAITVIQKWSNWMASKPYQERSGSKWPLKPQEESRFNDVNKFLKDISLW